jgi:hypothetical protein
VLAAAQGAERVSLLAEPVRPADGHAVTASVTLVVDRADVDRADVDRADVAAARPDAQAVFDWLVAEHDRVRAADPLATMDLTVLGQQSGVRRTWTASPPAGPRAASKHWQLVLPWPGRSSVALLTMASPCEPLWPQLEETFDACTRTFRWTWSSGGGGPGSD